MPLKSIIITVVSLVFSILISINAYFLNRIIIQIDKSYQVTSSHTSQLSLINYCQSENKKDIDLLLSRVADLQNKLIIVENSVVATDKEITNDIADLIEFADKLAETAYTRY